MSARHFDYFDDRWKTEVLECPHCHWLGTFEQGSVEYYAELMDCSCPKCDVFDAPMLAIVSYPTLEELRANQDRPGIREYVQLIDAGIDKYAERVVMERHQQRKQKQDEKFLERLCEAFENMPDDDPDHPEVMAAYFDKLRRTRKERDQKSQPPTPESENPELSEEQKKAVVNEVGQYVAEYFPAFKQIWKLNLPQKPE